MRSKYYILALMLGLAWLSCDRLSPDFTPFAGFDFENGDYKLYGFVSEGGGGDFVLKHGDFYLESKDELKKLQERWIFNKTNNQQPCGWEYVICLAYNDSLVSSFNINSACNYLIADTWYEFNPSLWNIISEDKIIHIDRDTARLIEDRLFNRVLIKINTPKVLVIPPYDEIANRGISPNIQNFLETTLSKNESVDLIKFSFKDLMNVPYYNIYDKKYAQPILEKTQTDYLIMSKLDFQNQTGKMSTDKWGFTIKIYDVVNDTQWISLRGANMTSVEIKDYIDKNVDVILETLK